VLRRLARQGVVPLHRDEAVRDLLEISSTPTVRARLPTATYPWQFLTPCF